MRKGMQRVLQNHVIFFPKPAQSNCDSLNQYSRGFRRSFSLGACLFILPVFPIQACMVQFPVYSGWRHGRIVVGSYEARSLAWMKAILTRTRTLTLRLWTHEIRPPAGCYEARSLSWSKAILTRTRTLTLRLWTLEITHFP